MIKIKRNLIGQKFGELTVIKFDENSDRDNRLKRRWIVKCKCGKEYSLSEHYLVYQKITTCYSCSSIKRRGKDTINCALWSNIKKRKKYDNIEISPFITRKFLWNLYLKQNKKCALSGLDIYLTSTKVDKKENTASLDRIDSSKGYFIDNVQWVHKIINKMKLDFDENYFIKLCENIAKTN